MTTVRGSTTKIRSLVTTVRGSTTKIPTSKVVMSTISVLTQKRNTPVFVPTTARGEVNYSTTNVSLVVGLSVGGVIVIFLGCWLFRHFFVVYIRRRVRVNYKVQDDGPPDVNNLPDNPPDVVNPEDIIPSVPEGGHVNCSNVARIIRSITRREFGVDRDGSSIQMDALEDVSFV